MKEKYFWPALRLVMSGIFLWAFFDKLLGLGFATEASKSWLSGGSPTAGFLKFGTEGGVFASYFQSLSGNVFVDFLFMAGLFSVGLALLLGIGLRIAGYAGSLMMFLIYLSLFPPVNNPLLDEHIVYITVLLGIARSNAGSFFGLGKAWGQMKLIKKYPLLK